MHCLLKYKHFSVFVMYLYVRITYEVFTLLEFSITYDWNIKENRFSECKRCVVFMAHRQNIIIKTEFISRRAFLWKLFTYIINMCVSKKYLVLLIQGNLRILILGWTYEKWNWNVTSQEYALSSLYNALRIFLLGIFLYIMWYVINLILVPPTVFVRVHQSTWFLLMVFMNFTKIPTIHKL